uniref:Uncharacterized protein n=1 Tax=virus sp. ctBM815 TaxID=2825806 RepID=A0A8S5RK47_9VIRU|nr:MAG TPA: hypothetical protein [virus sp. ctBM815]
MILTLLALRQKMLIGISIVSQRSGHIMQKTEL